MSDDARQDVECVMHCTRIAHDGGLRAQVRMNGVGLPEQDIEGLLHRIVRIPVQVQRRLGACGCDDGCTRLAGNRGDIVSPLRRRDR